MDTFAMPLSTTIATAQHHVQQLLKETDDALETLRQRAARKPTFVKRFAALDASLTAAINVTLANQAKATREDGTLVAYIDFNDPYILDEAELYMKTVQFARLQVNLLDQHWNVEPKLCKGVTDLIGDLYGAALILTLSPKL